VELASPFSTAGRLLTVEDGDGVTADVIIVQVDTVLVVDTLAGRTVAAAVLPVDFKVGITVADGLVKAAGLPSLSTKGLMGTVAVVAGVPALLGRGRVTVDCLGMVEKSSTGRGGGGC